MVVHGLGVMSRADAMVRVRQLSLLTCSAAVFMVMLDSTIVNVALPAIGRDLGAGLDGLQWVIDAYLIVFASLLLTAGAAGDRLGRRRLFRTGLVVFGLGSAAASLAPSLTLLVVCRITQAVGAAMVPSAGLAVVTHTFPGRRERAAALGIWSAVSGLSVAAGPLLGGLLVDWIGWRAIFWVNIPVGGLAYFLTTRYVAESRAAHPPRIDLPGQGLAIACLAALSYALIEGPNSGWQSPVIIVALTAAVASLLGFVFVERCRAEPLLDLGVFANHDFAGAAAGAILSFLALNGFLFLTVLYLQGVRGDSPLLSGLSLLPATAIIAVVAPLSGVLTARRGPRLPVVAGGLAMGSGLVLLARSAPHAAYGFLALAFGLIGLGLGLLNSPLTATAVSAMQTDQAGVAAGVVGTARQVGGVLGVAVVGSVATSRYHALLPSRLAALHLPTAAGAATHHATMAGFAAGPGRSERSPETVVTVLAATFTQAAHAGFLLAAVCAVLVSLIALLTFPARRRPRSAGSDGTHGDD